MLSRLVPLCVLAAGGAVALPALVLPVAGPPTAARVVFLIEPDPAALPTGISIDRWDGRQAVLSGVDAGGARALYALGAVVVYPLRATGCLSLPSA